ncbi:MAG: response regulator [Bacteroidia bacterium]
MEYIKNEITAIILEDDPEDAELIADILKKTRFTFTLHFAARLEEYQALLRLTNPHLILADYRLPDITGHEAMIMALECNSMIPFVFVTGSIGEQLAADTILSGAWGYVLKDNIKILPHVIETVVLKYNELVGNEFLPRVLATRNRVHKQILANNVILNKVHAFVNNQDAKMQEIANKNIQENNTGEDEVTPENNTDMKSEN